jgi:hypothetical protein
MRILKAVAVAVLCAAGMFGCNFGNNPADSFSGMDGSAGTMTAEVNSMGYTVEDKMSGGSLSKCLADTMKIEKIIVPWAYNATGGFWTRSSSSNFSNGTHVRIDTIWFKDVNNQVVDSPSIANVASFRHVRIVTDSLRHTWNFRYDISVAVNKTSNDTEFVHNGTATGSVNDTTFRTTTITNVTRQWLSAAHPHQQFPSAGTIIIDGISRTITIQFTGNGSAVATVVRTRDNKTKVFNIDVTTGVESSR